MPNQPKVCIANRAITVTVNPAFSLLNNYLMQNIPIQTVCGGKAACGRCRFRVIDGAAGLSPVRPAEIARLGDALIAAGWTAAMVDLHGEKRESGAGAPPAPVARTVASALLDSEASSTAYLEDAAVEFLNPLRGESGKLQMAFRTPETKLAEKGSSAGWQIVPARGLPNRYITGIAADPADPTTVYVALGGYANRQWWPPGSFNDRNPNFGEGHVYRSTDGGRSFTDVSGNLPDVPARSIEVRGSQLIVGTDVGMFVSDGPTSPTWTAPPGLPAAPVVSV